MELRAEELTAWLGQYFWPFTRVAACLGVAPLFGSRSVPARVRLVVALVLTVAVAPLVPPVPQVEPLSPQALLILAQQILIGAALGFGIQILFTALLVGGQLAAQGMGLGFAAMVDPEHGTQVPVVGQLYVLVATLLFLAFDGHLTLIRILAESFRTLPIGPEGLAAGRYWDLATWGGWLFAGALAVALPTVAALLLVNIAFGVLTRAAPQMNVFAVGFPLAILFGLLVLLAGLPAFGPRFLALAGEAFGLMGRVAGVALPGG
ncbi:MAG: flagellar biosynthetic protein FliR [Gammaproteobacteria bacterium]|nr:MAG: flagellar biosynthetic protein FliR [Gammaproteobacteria bacterium]